MSLQEDIQSLTQKMDKIEEKFRDEDIRRYKKKEWKLPLGIRMKSKRQVKKGKLLCVFLRTNKQMEFKVVDVINGVIQIDKYNVALYESDAVYIYKKMLPIVVVFEWRLLAVGGKAEEFNIKLMGGQDDADDAAKNGLSALGQTVIIRKIELAEIEKAKDTKKGGKGMIFLFIGIAIILYIVASSMGWV